MLGFQPFHAATKTIAGIKTMHMIRKVCPKVDITE